MKDRWPYRHDALVLGALAGLSGSVVRALLELLAIVFIPSYKSCIRLAAAIILAPEKAMHSTGAHLVGLEIDFVVGIVVGVVAVQILIRWGRDYLLLKGAIGGAVTWLLFYVHASGQLSKLHPSGTVLETEISLLVHLIFGMVVAWSAWAIERRHDPHGAQPDGKH